MQTLDQLKAHYDWLKTMIGQADNLNDKIPMMAELEATDMELRARITEGIGVDVLEALCNEFRKRTEQFLDDFLNTIINGKGEEPRGILSVD